MDDTERARLAEEARIKARETTKYSFKLVLKIMLIGTGIVVLGLATCSYIALHSLSGH
jgi:hypothetical protein